RRGPRTPPGRLPRRAEPVLALGRGGRPPPRRGGRGRGHLARREDRERPGPVRPGADRGLPGRLEAARRPDGGGVAPRGRARQPGDDRPGEERTVTAERAPLRVLVVDDSSAARLLIWEAMEESARRRGRAARITEAGDAFEALALLSREGFDLVLTDVNMPTLSGLELIRLIRSRPEQKALPVVAISTEREADDARRAREAGADGYLGKPFEPATLDRLLEQVLGGTRDGG
ncbi:response regulator, partial [Acidobacteria bacterium ACD]|nr:response regulator [Acidobacteria bacterium ACD]